MNFIQCKDVAMFVGGIALLLHRTFRASRVRAEIRVPDGTEELYAAGFLSESRKSRVCAKYLTRVVTVINRDFDWRGQVKRLGVALGHPGGKLLHQVLIGKLVELLNNILVVKG